jgi:hypothetical protein
MVNSRLDTALEQIEDLKSERQVARDAALGERQERMAPKPRPSGGHL